MDVKKVLKITCRCGKAHETQDYIVWDDDHLGGIYFTCDACKSTTLIREKAEAA